MKPGSEIFVSCADRIVWVRVESNGSEDFAKEIIYRGARFVQLSGDAFYVYGHARWNLVVAWRVGRRLFCRPTGSSFWLRLQLYPPTTTIVQVLSKMYTDAIKLIGNTATLPQSDGHIPSFNDVHNEALKAK